MKLNFRKIFKINFTLILVLIGILISAWLLFKNDFFETYNAALFSNIITPIATILAFIIYYATLIEIKNSNNRNIAFQKINLFKEQIGNLKTKLKSTRVYVPEEFEKSLNLRRKEIPT